LVEHWDSFSACKKSKSPAPTTPKFTFGGPGYLELIQGEIPVEQKWIVIKSSSIHSEEQKFQNQLCGKNIGGR